MRGSQEEERDIADKIFEILLNRVVSGMKRHQATMRFEKRRQRDGESIDQFLGDLESLRRRSDPEESTNRKNFSITWKFIDRVKSDNLGSMLATYYTLTKDNATTPEKMRQKYIGVIAINQKSIYFRNLQGGASSKGRRGTSRETIWTNAGRAQIVGQ